MLTKNQNGRNEINLARQRLIAAKKWNTNASQMMAVACRMIKDAQKELDSAKECLKTVEEQCEVIDVDMGDGSLLGESRKRKRTVSPAPQHQQPAVLLFLLLRLLQLLRMPSKVR